MSEYSQLIQMITALTNRLNDIEINGKKIDELNQLSTLNPSSKIHVSVGGQSFYVEVSQLIDAISNANHDHIVSINGDITVVGDLVAVPEIVWILSNIIYQTSVSTSFTIPYCATGLNRKDIFVLNASNQVVRIAGPEDADIVIKPNVPIGTLYLTEIDVSDSMVGAPVDPVIGTQFVKKQEYAETAIEGTGEITIDLTGESTAFRVLSNTIAKIKGFNASSEFMSQIFYIGKEIRLINDSGTDIILNHNDTSTAWPFRFPSEVDFVWKNKHVVIFRPTKTDAQYLEFQSDSVDVQSSESMSQRYPNKYWHKSNGVSINDYGDNALISTGTSTFENLSGGGQSYSVRTTNATAGSSASLYQASFGRKRSDKGGYYVKHFFLNANGSSAFRGFSGIGQVAAIGNINPSVAGASLYGLMADASDAVYHFMYKVGIAAAVKIPLTGWNKTGKKYFTLIEEHVTGTTETIVKIINYTDGLVYSATLPFVFEGAQKIEVNNGTDNIAVSFGLALDELNTEL